MFPWVAVTFFLLTRKKNKREGGRERRERERKRKRKRERVAFPEKRGKKKAVRLWRKKKVIIKNKKKRTGYWRQRERKSHTG